MRAIQNPDRSRLIAAAMQRIPCDLTIQNIRLVNVITGEIYPAEVDVLDGVIVRVREGRGQACRRKRFTTAAAHTCCPALSTSICMWRAP